MPELTHTKAVGSYILEAKTVKLDYIKKTGVQNKFDGKKAEEFTIASLNEGERKRAREICQIANALLLKGLLHRFDPAMYPLPSDSSSPEAIIFREVVAKISPKAFERMRPRLNLNPEGLKPKKLIPKKLKLALGSLWQIDFHKADLMPYFESMSVKPQQHALLPVLSIPTPTPLLPPVAPLPAAPSYSRLDLILRTLHCVDETNPEGGTDDMILGGAKIEANGGLGVMNSFICGEYEDSQLHNFGEIPLAQYDLSSTAGYPKTIYGVFHLVESDSDDKEVAEGLTNAIATSVSVIAPFFSAGAGAIVGALVSLIGAFIGIFIDDDYFPPFGIRLTLNSQNEFGGPISPDMSTGDITAHGGTYRIGYKWILSA